MRGEPSVVVGIEVPEEIRVEEGSSRGLVGVESWVGLTN